MAFWLGGASLLEVFLTRQARARRAETLPFAQAQITRAWWMLLCVGCLSSFAMFFYGGGIMIYSLWIVLLGLGIYLFGLFSRPLIEWIGLTAILLGVLSLVAGLPLGANRWLTASCFAVGMPLTGWLAARVDDRPLFNRSGALLLWVGLVTVPPLSIAHLATVDPPGVAAQILTEPGLTVDRKVLRLEAGTALPLRLNLESPIVGVAPEATLPMKLLMPVEVSLLDGEPDGRYRIGDGPWQRIRDGVLRLYIYRVIPRLHDGAPEVRLQGSFKGPELTEK